MRDKFRWRPNFTPLGVMVGVFILLFLTAFTTTPVQAQDVGITKSGPATLPEPGGPVTYSFVITASPTVSVNLTSLVDTFTLPSNITVTTPAATDTCGALPMSITTTFSCIRVFNIAPITTYFPSGQLVTNTVAATAEVTSDGVMTTTVVTDESTLETVNTSPDAEALKLVDADGDGIFSTNETIPEPGALVTYTFTITNISPINTDPISALTFGDVAVDSIGNTFIINFLTTSVCPPFTPLPVGSAYSCTYTNTISGNAGYTVTNDILFVYTDDEDGDSGLKSNQATVSLTDVDPTIKLEKSASPTQLTAPGGMVTFNVVITNTSPASTDPVTLTTLVDSVYGNLISPTLCGTAPVTITPGGTHTCTFTQMISGADGFVETNIITATVEDDEENEASASDDATVEIQDAFTPTLEVLKVANPITLTEPGGVFNFTVFVTNTSPITSGDPVTITSLVDVISGAPISLNGVGTCSLPQFLNPGQGYTCTFNQTLTGNAGDTFPDTVIAQGEDDEGTPVEGEDDEEVRLVNRVPTIEVLKIANPITLTEPGGVFNFTVFVTNTSPITSSDPVTITSLVDIIDGVPINLDGIGTCSLPQFLNPGEGFSCTFNQTITGNAGDTVTDVVVADGVDDDGTQLEDQDDENVSLVDVEPSIEVLKLANPTTIAEPGGPVAFTVVVTNTSLASSDPITLTNLTDVMLGGAPINLNGPCGLPQLIQPGGSLTCIFTQTVVGDAGDVITDTVTAQGTDDEGNPVEDEDTEEVTVVDNAPSIVLEKIAMPDVVTAPGGIVNYTVIVTNTSTGTDPVTILTLTDVITTTPIDLNGLGNCAVPQLLAPGASYSCTFPLVVSGAAGDVITDTVTAQGEDDEGDPVEDEDDETVTVIAPLSDQIIDVIKNADPINIAEPGAIVTFTVAIENISPISNTVTIITLTDNIHGNLDGQGDCSVPITIAFGDTYICRFSQFVAGDGGDVEIDTVTAEGEDEDGTPTSDEDDAIVNIGDVDPEIQLIKTASPTTVPEPGGLVTFTVVVNNDSVTTDPITILTMTDSIYGDLDGLGDCTLPQVLAPGGSYACTFQAIVIGNAGESETNIITAEGTDDEGNPVEDEDDATVLIEDEDPEISVIKTASPSTIFEPGGDVAFTVQIDNDSLSSTDPVTITSLSDSIYGNLDGQGTCALPQLIPAGLHYSCTFTETVTGNAGDNEINVVTASGEDDEGNPVEDDDDATVLIIDRPPSIDLLKSATPDVVPEAGANVTFTVIITNTSFSPNDPITILTLTDSIYGNLDGQGSCSVPVTIAVGDTYTCSFTQLVSGNVGDVERNVITGEGEDDEGNPVSAEDDEVVFIEDSDAIISLVKTVDANGDGLFNDSETMPEPGGAVDYLIVVSNDSPADDVTINMVNDPMLGGDISTDCAPLIPATISPGQTITCTVSGMINGNAGDTVTNVATATGVDEDGEPVADSDDADVTLVDVDPELDVIKTADPVTVTEPGGNVLFTLVVENDSVASDPVTLETMVDDIHGDLNGQGSCSVPQTLDPGDSYACSFIVFVSGNGGDSEVDTITVSGRDDEGNEVEDEDDAEVLFINEDPIIDVIKTANPVNVPEPGADVDFTVVVQNESNTADPVTITSLVDSIHGNLDGQGSCAMPQVIAPGGSYSCIFTAFVAGNAGDSEINVVTAEGTDDDGTPVSDDDDAVVTVSDVAPAIVVIKDANINVVGLAGSDVTFSVVITNVSVSTDPVTITSLIDSIYGNLNSMGSCAMPQTLTPSGPGSSYSCDFTVNISGNEGDSETNVVTAQGFDDEGNPVADADDETVTVNDLDPFLEVRKGVDANGDGVYTNGETVPEPGGPTRYRIEVENISTSDITITAIDDPELGGDISADCTPSPATALRPGEIIVCLVDSSFSGDAGDSLLNIVSATGIDDNGNTITDTADATVIVANVEPMLSLVKSADPTNVPESGSDVDFTIVITNDSVTTDPVTLFSLQDSIYGNLDGQGDCSLPQTLDPGGSYSCTFSAFVERNAFDDETNVAIVAGTDNEGNQAIAFDDETVEIDDVEPSLNVIKTVEPESVDEPGGDAVFFVTIENSSSTFDPLTLNRLVDDIHGNLNGRGSCILPQIIQPSDSYTCSFTAFVAGDADDSETDTITATAVDDEGNRARGDDDATVTVADVMPVIRVDKSANPNAVPEPGGDVAFTVIVTNESVESDPVTITDLVDDIHGDLDGQGSCSLPQILNPDESYACTFTVFVGGNAEEMEMDTITATGQDNEGNSVEAEDKATVRITDVLPVLRVEKTPDVNTVSEEGGDVTFTIRVNNESVTTDPITLNSLTDSIYGDLDGLGICAVPQTIQPGEDYVCTFTVNLTGNAGDSETNIVTAEGTDDEGNPTSDTDTATVTIGNLGANLDVTKEVDANGDGTYSASEILVAPGGTVAYRITIENTSAVDAITLEQVDDSLLGGDISSSCVPGLPTEMAPGTTVVCTLTEDIVGEAGDNIVNVVTVSGSDDEGNPVSANADATVAIIAPVADLAIIKELTDVTLDKPVDPSLLTATYRIRYTNNGPDAAPNVRIIDALPDGMLVESTSLPFSTIDLPLLTWELGTLQPGDTGQIVIVATIDRALQGEELTNVANISCGCTDPNPANDEDTADLIVPQDIVPNNPTAVTLISFRADLVGDAIKVRWTTSEETDTSGFDLYRSTSHRLTDAVKVTPTKIASQGSLGGDYSFLDSTALPGVTYIYWLVETEVGGIQNAYGPVQESVAANVFSLPEGFNSKYHLYLPMISR